MLRQNCAFALINVWHDLAKTWAAHLPRNSVLGEDWYQNSATRFFFFTSTISKDQIWPTKEDANNNESLIQWGLSLLGWKEASRSIIIVYEILTEQPRFKDCSLGLTQSCVSRWKQIVVASNDTSTLKQFM